MGWAGVVMVVLSAGLPAKTVPGASPPRERVVHAARSYLGEGRFRGDCSSFVLAVFERADIPLDVHDGSARTRSEALYRQARRVRRPRPGDIAVFHNTYDRNHDGRWNDAFTHVAIVERVHGAQVTLIDHERSGVRRLQMNLRHPANPAENSVLRERGGRALAGQLFAGFGRLL